MNKNRIVKVLELALEHLELCDDRCFETAEKGAEAIIQIKSLLRELARENKAVSK